MSQAGQIFTTSLSQAFLELKANRLRTFLSLLGITIGIFSIIAVLTVVDSLEKNIQTSVSSLGSDVLYVNRKPWMGEKDGEFKWWEYLQRKPMSLSDLNNIERNVAGVRFASICYFKDGITLKYNDAELGDVVAYAVTDHFDQIQNVEVETGRYLSASELGGSGNSIVIGQDIYKALFGNKDAIGKDVRIQGRSLRVVGIMKKTGQNMAGFDFDKAFIMSYYLAAGMYDTHSLSWSNDPVILVKVGKGILPEDVRDELTGSLRTLRRVRPGGNNNFAINELSQLSETLTTLFSSIRVIGIMIAVFALIVGSFGIANIMFVTVKERTKIIGLKKAIGARRVVILSEFLIEAVVLCLIGGATGILLVFLLGLALTYGADFEIMLSFKNVFIGVFISAIVGVLAGFIPALRASRLNPVVAIRST